jgi:hypothetical protein
MNGPHTPDQASNRKKPMSPSGAKPSSARLGQPGRATPTPSYAGRPSDKATSQRGRPQAKAGQKPQPASAPTKQTDGDPAKSRITISKWWGTLIGLAAIAYFSYQTITVGFDYISLFLTFAGLSLGAWLAVAWIAIQFVRLNWLIIIYLPAATTVTLGFAAMNRPEPLIFFKRAHFCSPWSLYCLSGRMDFQWIRARSMRCNCIWATRPRRSWLCRHPCNGRREPIY